MNRLKAEVLHVNTLDGFSVVDAALEQDQLAFILIETPETANYLRSGEGVELVFKESEVLLFQQRPETTTLNVLSTNVKSLNDDKVFTRVTLKYGEHLLSALVLSQKVKDWKLQRGQEVFIGINPFEIAVAR